MSLRIFVGLRIPPLHRQQLCLLQHGNDGAKWGPEENFHLTLRFIGEVPEPFCADIDAALGEIKAPAFDLTIKGVGQFGDRKPRAIWADLIACPELSHLQSKIEIALQRCGLPPEGRTFTPHITLARFRHRMSKPHLNTWLATNQELDLVSFPVSDFILFSSLLGNTASVYKEEAAYSLVSASGK